MKRLASFALLAAVVLQMAACNTLNGIGKDIKKGGEVIENAASK